MPDPLSSRILVRGVNWLGDAVLSTPALLRLRAAQPRAHISILTDVKLADLWQHHPAVDSVLTFANGESIWTVASKLRAKNFQIGLVLPNSPRSALEVWLARIPQRVGYAGRGRSWFLTDAIPRSPGTVEMRKRSIREIQRLIASNLKQPPRQFPATAHHLHHYLYLVSHLGASPEPVAPQIYVTAEEVQEFCRRFRIPERETGPRLGLNPGAEYGPAKRWPAERFAAAAIDIHRRTQGRWLIFGGQADSSLAAQIAETINRASRPQGFPEPESSPAAALNLAGQTTLRELCAGLKVCQVALTNDTGPMHLAAAVGTPVIVPFGSTSPELTGPGLPGDPRHHLLKARVPCSPCFRRECPIDFRCMNDIGVEQVVETVLKLFV